MSNGWVIEGSSRAGARAPCRRGSGRYRASAGPAQATTQPDFRSVGAGSLVDGDALDERRVHPRVGDLLGRMGEQVAIEDREIGVLADLDRAGDVVEVVHVRRADRERGERGREVESLLG